MKEIRNLVLTGVLAFAGGVVAGILMAPASGSRTRRRIAGEARSQLHHFEKKLDGLEKKLDSIQRQVRKSGADLGERVIDATKQAMAAIPTDTEAFKVAAGDVADELRRMPKS